MAEEEEFAVYSPFNHVYKEPDEETLPAYLLNRVNEILEEHGDRTWMTDHSTGESQLLSEIAPQSDKVASWFYKHGMRKGDTLVYMTYHLARLHTVFIGVWKANGLVRATYPEDDAETLEGRVEESRAGWILCDAELAELCKSVADKFYWGVEVIVIGDTEVEGCINFSELFEDEGDEVPELEVSRDDPCLILCTSGTTGKSKGAVHSHKSFMNAVVGVNFVPFQSPMLAITKGTHISGCFFPLSFMSTNKSLIVVSRITKEAMFEAVDKYKPKCLWSFPTFILMMVIDPAAEGYDFSSLEVVMTGGAQVTPEMERTMLQIPNVKAVLVIYGLTEMAPITADVNYDFEEEGDLESTKLTGENYMAYRGGGLKPCPGVAVQIRDPETGEVIAEPMKEGEICAKGTLCFTHYINNEEGTKNTFVDGWFKTGDLGFFDLEGFIYLVDRLKDVFKYWNNHISPSEVEEVINQHEAIGEVCVIGVPDPDGGGFVPRAFGVTVVNDYDVNEIIEFTNSRLPAYKHLRGGLYIVPELPKGKTGKVQRNLVAELPLPDTDAAPDEDNHEYVDTSEEVTEDAQVEEFADGNNED